MSRLFILFSVAVLVACTASKPPAPALNDLMSDATSGSGNVCCRTNFSDTRCTQANTTWMSKSNCDQFGAQGSDGKKTCEASVCGH